MDVSKSEYNLNINDPVPVILLTLCASSGEEMVRRAAASRFMMYTSLFFSIAPVRFSEWGHDKWLLQKYYDSLM